MLIYKSLYEISCSTKTIRVNTKYIKREPWVTSGILTSSINKEKLLRKKINKPNPEIEKAYRVYCRLFNKIKRAAKTKHYTEILDSDFIRNILLNTQYCIYLKTLQTQMTKLPKILHYIGCVS